MCNRNDPYNLRVNEISEPLNAIKMAREFLDHAGQDTYYLKWALIAIHNALQGFMVLALKGTCSLPVIKWKEEYKEKNTYEILSDPDKQLISFLELFKRIKQKRYMQNNAFQDTCGITTKSIRDINNVRNDFIHYLPKGWSIGIKGLARRLMDSLTVISFLTRVCSEVTRYYSEQELNEISQSIEACNSVLQALLFRP